MNFFEHQRLARKEGKLLWGLFLFAVLAIVVAVDVAVWVGWEIYASHQGFDSYGYDPATSAMAVLCSTVVTLAVIFLGSLYKTSLLKMGGGNYVAESMGARRVEMDTTDLLEKRLVNVVEEMSIASGSSTPSIWIMDDETGINAFAAGYAPSEAAIAVSRGCLTELSRDELQGVVAHEFSHVFNGDMRTNIRMLGVLHGILVIGLSGYWALRVFGESRGYRKRSSSKNDSAGGVILAVVVVGASLVAIGYVGLFFGRLIKASLSRSREYLADASAVQFTRNPAGIAGALAKIYRGTGSVLASKNSEQFSHFFFADGVGFFAPFFATHPPLQKRLDRILPDWENALPEASTNFAQAPEESKAGTKTSVLNSIGTSGVSQILFASELLESIPPIIHKLVSVPKGAQLIFSALLNVEHATLPEAVERKLIEEHPPQVFRDAHQQLRALGDGSWLAIANLCMPSIQRLSFSDRAQFTQFCHEVIALDGTTTALEASLLSVLEQGLSSSSSKRKIRFTHINQVKQQIVSLAAILAIEGSESDQKRYAFFRKGLEHADLPGYIPEHLPHVTVDAMPQLLKVLAQASPELKEVAMRTFIEVSQADGVSTTREKEILRTMAASLECPLPPFA